MYRLAVLVVMTRLAACDLQPPPPKAAPPPTPAAVTPTPAAGSGSAAPAKPATPPAPADAGGVPVPHLDGGTHVQVTQPCLDAGVRFAQLVVDNEKEPTKRSFLEQDRTRLVKTMSENCSRDQWSQKSLDCFAKAASVAEAQACSAQLKAP